MFCPRQARNTTETREFALAQVLGLVAFRIDSEVVSGLDANEHHKEGRLRQLIILASAISLVACSGGGSGSGSGATGGSGTGIDIPEPEGNDDLVGLSSVASTEDALFQAIAVDDGYAYVCTGAHGMLIVDLSDITSIASAQQVTFADGNGCRSVGVATDGSILVTGQSQSEPGSWIELRSPGKNSQVQASLNIAQNVEYLAGTNSHVFAALGDDGLMVFGRNDGALASISSVIGFDTVLGVTVWDNSTILAAVGAEGVAVIDISDPTVPTVAATYGTKKNTARRIVVQNDIAYVAAVNTVQTFDLAAANPESTNELWLTYGSAVDLAITENGSLFVANLEDLAVLDATDPSNLRLSASEMIASTAGGNARVVGVSAIGEVAVAVEWSSVGTYQYLPDRTGPDVRVDRLSIDFGVASLKKGKGLVIENLGDEPLEITNVETDNPLFEPELSIIGSSDPTQATLPPCSDDPNACKGILQIKFLPEDSVTAVNGIVSVTTNDPDEGVVQIAVKANDLDGAGVGAPFDPNGEMVYTDSKTGNDVTIKGQHPGKVVLLAYFATW